MKTKQKLIAGTVKFVCLVAGVFAGLIQTASAQLTIQIVNDSGLADSNIYVMVPGTINQTANTNPPITPANLFVGKNVGTNVAVALSTLAANGSQPTFPIVSTISGNTDTVYSIQADNIASGGIYFIYNQAFGFTNGITPSPAAGSPFSPYRFDYAELSFDDSPAVVNDIDLTYVDKFGIPMQLEWFHGTNASATNLLAGSYVYASTKTLTGIFSSSGFSNAVFSLNSTNIMPGWTYAGTNSYADFARILAPQKITTDFPYPSITNYLNYLTANPFVLNGYSVQGTNYYLGYQVSTTRTSDPLTGIPEWLFTLAYNSNSVPAQYSLPDIGAANIQEQYTNTITFLVPNVTVTTNYVVNTNPPVTTNIFFITNNADVNAYVYGSPVGPGIYSVNGSPVTNTNGGSYSVESWMIGDVFSAINFGFAGGIYGTNSDQWFSPNVTWPDPYGWAQPSASSQITNAYYNAYAALMYYNADAYSYAFSERITPGVGLPVADNDVVRITILPDDRLDSPVVSVPVNTITETNLTLAWSPVSGATGYQVNLLRPTGTLGFAPAYLPANATSYTFKGLMAGAPYVMSVQAMGTNNGNPIITPARPVSATTSGVYTTINGNSSYQMAASFSVPDTFYQLGKVYINGIELLRTNVVVTNTDWLLTNGQNANWTASPGTNQVPITVYDNNDNLIFNDWLTFTVLTNSGAAGGVITTNAFFFGQITGGGPVAANPNPETVTTPNYQTVIGLSYKPAPILQYAPQAAAAPLPSGVTITGVTALPGGGLQFNFDVPAGTNYVVESTTNLLSGTWQTNASGTGQSSGESYTNTAGASAAQFYRIKM